MAWPGSQFTPITLNSRNKQVSCSSIFYSLLRSFVFELSYEELCQTHAKGDDTENTKFQVTTAAKIVTLRGSAAQTLRLGSDLL